MCPVLISARRNEGTHVVTLCDWMQRQIKAVSLVPCFHLRYARVGGWAQERGIDPSRP